MPLPSYPPTSDIGYAGWLRNFATQLPHVASRYELMPAEISDAQDIATEFTNWLIYRIRLATQMRVESQHPVAIALKLGPPPPFPKKIFLLDRVGMLVQRIRSHPDYNQADAELLGITSNAKVFNGQTH